MTLKEIKPDKICKYCYKIFETKERRKLHEKIICKKKKVCDRCARNSHKINECYAKTHLEGYELDE